MVTAAAVAHVNRLPVLLLPGDVFADRRPDPVLQQVEHFGDPTISANDCFRPVSRFFDRITRPEQLLASLPAALRVLTDPAECGPATIAFPQDVQTEAFDCPAAFFRPRLHRPRAPEPDAHDLAEAAEAHAPRQAPADHRRWRGEICRRGRDAGPLCRDARHPGGGNPGRQGQPRPGTMRATPARSA